MIERLAGKSDRNRVSLRPRSGRNPLWELDAACVTSFSVRNSGSHAAGCDGTRFAIGFRQPSSPCHLAWSTPSNGGWWIAAVVLPIRASECHAVVHPLLAVSVLADIFPHGHFELAALGELGPGRDRGITLRSLPGVGCRPFTCSRGSFFRWKSVFT